MFYAAIPTRSIYQVISSFRRTVKWRLIKNYNIFRFFLYLRNLSPFQDSTPIFFSGNSFQIQKAHASLFATLKPAVDLSCRWQSSCCPKCIKYLSKQLCTQEIRLLLFLMSGLVAPVHPGPPACSTQRHLLAEALLDVHVRFGGNRSWAFTQKVGWCGRRLGVGFELYSCSKSCTGLFIFCSRWGMVVSLQSVEAACL